MSALGTIAHRARELGLAAPTASDRVVGFFSPRAGLRRAAARMQMDVIMKRAAGGGYEAGATTDRMSTWLAPRSSGTAAVRWNQSTVRARVRDLCRNDEWMKTGLETVDSETIGIGIVPTITGPNARKAARIRALWNLWAGSTACDAEGLSDFYGLESLVMRTVAESGSSLVRRRPKNSRAGLPVPLQLQVLEPDYLDQNRDHYSTSGERVICGIQFTGESDRTGYWLFKYHPGDANVWQPYASTLVPASEVLHIFRRGRAGQVTDIPWPFSGVIRARTFNEFEDAQLMKAKVAACFAGFIEDIEMPDTIAIGKGSKMLDYIEPASLETLPPGKKITFPNPPATSEYGEYSATQLRAIANAWGISYEALTGDYRRVNFASGRIGALRMKKNVNRWRWRMIIPRFCDPAFEWFLEACEVMGEDVTGITASWTPPKTEYMDPQAEMLAARDSVRAGIKTVSEVVRENGDDPETHFAEYAEDMKRLDKLGLKIECDPRVPLAGGAKADQAKQAGPNDSSD